MKNLKNLINVFFNRNQEDNSKVEVQSLTKEIKELREKSEWLKKDIARITTNVLKLKSERLNAVIVAIVISFTLSFSSCGVSQYAGSIEYKTVTWADNETIYWISLDSTRTGTIRNTEHIPCFVGDTLELKSYHK